MNLETFTQEVKTALGEELITLTVYGSAATGEDTKKYSDINTLIVAKKLDLPVLKRLSTAVAGWVKKGQPAPILFTKDRLEKSVDVFPIEILDMKERHKVLVGEDILPDLEVDTKHLRFQVEQELKGKFIQLRDGYLLTGNKPKLIAELLVQSLSTFQLLFRAALRLYEPNEASTKKAAPQRLASHIEFSAEPFEQVVRLRSGELKPKDINLEGLFADYLSAVSTVADAVDQLES